MSELFERKLHLPVSAEEAFAWHERPGELDRLIPPWESVSIKSRGDGIRDEPQALVQTQYEFRQPTLDSALRHLLGKPQRQSPDMHRIDTEGR